LWAFKISETLFEICCIPFFTYGIALGDKVECNHGFTVQRVTEKSGHKTLRIAVVSKNSQYHLHEVLHKWVENTGLFYEWYAPGYLAVDIPHSQTKVDMSVLDQLSRVGEISLEIDK